MKVLLITALISTTSVTAMPSFEKVRAEWRSSDPRLLDRHGLILQESRQFYGGRRLEWVGLDAISTGATSAVIRAEDRRFQDHGGVDWRASLAGALGSVLARGGRGASTITMQLATVLDPSLRPKQGRRGIWQKWQQMQGAWDLEKLWTKDQILEAYLNLVSFRGELRGVGSASRALFDKDPHGLSPAEGTVLAVLIRSPNALVDVVARRACLLAGKGLPCADAEIAAGIALGQTPRIRPRANLAPHAARLFGSRQADVRTTLDRDVQLFAQEALQRYLAALKDEHVADGAVLAIDNRTGEVLAYVGNAQSASQVDGIRARRQAGSTLKPFLYGLAFEQRKLTPTSLLLDAPLDVPFARGVYRPANSDNLFRGPVSVRRALAQSLNVPAVRTLLLVGGSEFTERLADLGFETLHSAEHYGPSIALGSADVSLWELTNAYRTLANGGAWGRASLLSTNAGAAKSRRVLSPQSTYLVSDILSDRESRAEAFGREGPLTTKFWSAVKTGTSKDMRDNWCVGYTSQYTVGVWVGNFNGSSMWNVSGASGAAPIWKEVISFLNRRRGSQRPRMPAHVVAAVGEKFLRGTEPGEAPSVLSMGVPHIGYPTAGSRFAWDPDIPPDSQRIVFEATGVDASHQWVLDGHTLGPAQTSFPWRPEAGTHALTLVAANGTVVDTVAFEVRGTDVPETDPPGETLEFL